MQGILEKEIGEIQSQVYSTGMNKQFVIDVKNEMSAGEELSLRVKTFYKLKMNANDRFYRHNMVEYHFLKK